MAYLSYDSVTNRAVRKLVAALAAADSVTESAKATTYITLVDADLVAIAEEKGVRDTDDIDGTTHRIVQDYLINRFCERIVEDVMFTSAPETPEYDKYAKMYEHFHDKAQENRSQITTEMLTDEIDQASDRAYQTAILLRG